MRPGKSSLNVRKQPCHEGDWHIERYGHHIFSKFMGFSVGRPWHFACRVGEASNPGPPPSFADTLDEAEAVSPLNELFVGNN